MRAILTLLILLSFSYEAWAYNPGPGERAADFRAWDIVGREVVDLADYHGKWVFVEFWASWCGPCLDELPNLLAVTNPLHSRDDFKMISVTLDDERRTKRLNQLIEDNGITYPVLYVAEGWDYSPAGEWSVGTIPRSYLINPEGIIVAARLRGETLEPLLDPFLNQSDGYMPVGLRTSYMHNDDDTVSLLVDVYNPTHEPLELKVEYWHRNWVWADDDPLHEGRVIDAIEIGKERGSPDIDLLVEFDEFGSRVFHFEIPVVVGTDDVTFYTWVGIPGAEDYPYDGLVNSGHGLGLSDIARVRYRDNDEDTETK